MIDSTLVNEVAELVRQTAKVPPHVTITADSRLVEDLAIDSLDLVGVLLAVQDRFDIVIDDDVVPSLRRIVDLAETVAKDRGRAAAGSNAARALGQPITAWEGNPSWSGGV